MNPPPAPTSVASGVDAREDAGRRHPPKPRLILNVGVTGHRPPHLPVDAFGLAKEQGRLILSEIASTLSNLISEKGEDRSTFEPPKVRVISSLAEGADRIIAEAGLDLGMELQCPLPFHRDEYERDFPSETSRLEYRRLLGKATSVFELDGDREDEASAYLNAGRVMLEHTDILIAIWDGEKARGRGGTAEIVARAMAVGLPVVHLNLHSSNEGERKAQIRLYGSHLPWRERLHDELREWLGTDAESAARTQLYFSETEQRTNYGWAFSLFRNLICLRRPWGGSTKLPDYFERTKAELKRWRASSCLPENVTHAYETSFGPHYAWADNLAIYYAGLFRSVYLLRYTLSMLAMLFTIVGSFSPFAWQAFLLQALSVTALIGVVMLEKKKRWHLRSLEYRLFAEQLRLLYFSFPLGWGVERISQLGGELRMPPRWITRQLRKIVREGGLVSTKITPSYLRANLDFLRRANVEEQIEYHRKLGWNGTMAQHLYRMAMFFFALGVLAVISRAVAYQWLPHLMVNSYSDTPLWEKPLVYWIKIMSVLFPALGITLAHIRGHGEFARIGARSATMLQFLEARNEALLTFETAKLDPDWDATSLVTRKIAHEMVGELIDWRTLNAGKGLSLPV